VITIRARTLPDLDELASLIARVRMVDGYPIHLPDDDARRFLTDPSPIGAWVADDGGRVVGHVAVNLSSNQAVMDVVHEAGFDGGVGFIARLLVDPDVRRKGIGRQLLERGKAHLLSLGRTPVLDVVASSTAAISLYGSSGWTVIGTAQFELPGQLITELVFTTHA
jgi:ribosomal protein S18 acetylase RimI-like enzyme